MKKRKKQIKKIGLPPGTLIYTGHVKEVSTEIEVYNYDPSTLENKTFKHFQELLDFQQNNLNCWINVNGIHDVALIQQFEKSFNVHALLLEDIVNIHQRPKIEDQGDLIFFSLKMLSYNEAEKEIDEEQVSFILSENTLISFQEKTGDVFEPIRERIQNELGKIRERKVDYLAYALMDVIVDHYFLIIEKVGEDIGNLEEEIFNNPTEHNLKEIMKNKEKLSLLRRSIFPLRESISKLLKSEYKLIEKRNFKYFNDVYDHTIQVIENIEYLREINANLRDLYLSGINLQMNKVMQVLTLTATIFIPLTFVAGVYGMNFENMPELSWEYGYFGIMGFMFIIAIALLILFKKKRWI